MNPDLAAREPGAQRGWREYGVPAVVNVEGVMEAVKTGDRLRVDGDQGIVVRLDGGTPT